MRKFDFELRNIYSKDRIYFEYQICEIAEKYNLSITDCTKQDNEITVALDDEGEPFWEFTLLTKRLSFHRLFKLRWSFFSSKENWFLNNLRPN